MAKKEEELLKKLGLQEKQLKDQVDEYKNKLNEKDQQIEEI